MALPLVAVVGRPNVGKSTFVNRIIGAEDAIVHEMRGVTRDRSYHTADWNGVDFTLVDTGGIEMGSDDDFQASIRNQAFTATHEADVIIFLVDSRTGINADDEEVEIDGVLADYNDLQRRQGFDLRPYSGLGCTVYSYIVTNYETDEPVLCTIYLYKNRVIAGDIHSTSLDGFMHGIRKS